MCATSQRSAWTRVAPWLLLAGILLFPPARASGQSSNNNSDLTVTMTSSVGSPNGADFANGSWVVATLAYTVRCGSNRANCTLKIATSGILTKPSGSITQLEYSFDGSPFAAVPSTPTQLGASIPATKSGTIVVRYQLGWAGSPFTPASPSAYSQLVQLTITQNQ